MYNVYSIFFINGLHDRLMQHGYHILRPFGKYFANDSIVKEWMPSRYEKANECNRRVS